MNSKMAEDIEEAMNPDPQKLICTKHKIKDRILGIFVVFIASSLVDLYTNKSKFFKWLSIVNLILFIRWVVFSKGDSAAGGII